MSAEGLGEANCIQSLADVAFECSEYERARSHYKEARPLFCRVGNVLGEANCLSGLGDIAMADGNLDQARRDWDRALEFYGRIPEPYSIGQTHRRLARIAWTDDERRTHVAAARAAWVSIKRDDLVAELDAEFEPD